MVSAGAHRTRRTRPLTCTCDDPADLARIDPHQLGSEGNVGNDQAKSLKLFFRIFAVAMVPMTASFPTVRPRSVWPNAGHATD